MSENLSEMSDKSSYGTDMLGDVLGRILGSQIPSENSADGVGGESQSTVAASIGNAQNPMGDIFSSLLSRPELLVKLPTVISAAKPIIELFSQSRKESGEAREDAKEVAEISTNAKSHSESE